MMILMPMQMLRGDCNSIFYILIQGSLTLLHSEWPKCHRLLAVLSAIRLTLSAISNTEMILMRSTTHIFSKTSKISSPVFHKWWPKNDSNLHVTCRRECQIKDGLHRHPLQRQFTTTSVHVNLANVIVDIPRQTKITDLYRLVLAD